MRTCSNASRPKRASRISPFTLATAFKTPLPPKRDLSPSRSSMASRTPVEAPEGTEARPKAPESKTTSHSTGLDLYNCAHACSLISKIKDICPKLEPPYTKHGAFILNAHQRQRGLRHDNHLTVNCSLMGRKGSLVVNELCLPCHSGSFLKNSLWRADDASSASLDICLSTGITEC